MKTITVFLGIIILLYTSYRIYRIRNLDNGIDTKLKLGAIVLDVRTKSEFANGHIENSVNIPLSKLHEKEIPLDKTKTYITCCSHGLRSIKALSLLKEHGFTKVYNGGAWKDLQLIINELNNGN